MKYELNNIYNEDCLEAMKQMPDKYFDLAIVDPPYGIKMSNDSRFGEFFTVNLGNKSKKIKCNSYKKSNWDNNPPNKEYFNELFRISKNQIIFGANHFIEQFNKNSSCWIIWDKKNGKNNNADCELAWTSFNTAVRMFSFKWNGMLQENMKNKEIRIHPTQKPVALYEWLLNNYAKKGDMILDTHLGSASSIIACKKFGFEYLGFELDKEYFNKAKERIEKFESQENLFDFINTSETILIKQTTLF